MIAKTMPPIRAAIGRSGPYPMTIRPAMAQLNGDRRAADAGSRVTAPDTTPVVESGSPRWTTQDHCRRDGLGAVALRRADLGGAGAHAPRVRGDGMRLDATERVNALLLEFLG